MRWRVLAFTFSSCLIILFTDGYASAATKTLSPNDFYNLIFKRNTDLISAREDIKQSNILIKSVRRLDTPNLTLTTTKSNFQLENPSVPYSTGLNAQEYDTALTGQLHRWGFNYIFGYSYFKNNQGAITEGDSIDQDGHAAKIAFEFDLMRDAGFLVGTLPDLLAQEQGKVSQVANKVKVQALTRDLLIRYLSAMVLQQKIKSLRSVVDESKRLQKIYKSFYDEGRISEVDVLTSNIQVADAESSILDLSSKLATEVREMLVFSGGQDAGIPDGEVELQELGLDYIAGDKVAATAPAGPMDRSKSLDIQLLDQRQHSLDLQIQQLQNKKLPSLKFVTGKNWTKNAPAIGLITVADSTVDQWYVGLKFEIPLDQVGPDSDLASKRVELIGNQEREKLLLENIQTETQRIKSELAMLEAQVKLSSDLMQMAKDRYHATLPLIDRSALARIDIFSYQTQIINYRNTIFEQRATVLRLRAELLTLQGDYVPGVKL